MPEIPFGIYGGLIPGGEIGRFMVYADHLDIHLIAPG
jgi:hypothetical protein